MKNFLYLVGGTSLAQLITIAASPLLSRIFTPEDFGNFAILTTLVYFFTAFISLRLDFAILASVNENELGWLIKKSITILIILSIVLGILSIAYYETQKENFIIALFVPCLVFISGIFNIFNNITLKKQFSHITAKAKILQSGGGVLSQLLLGLAGLGFIGMVVGQILGFLYSNFYMLRHIKDLLLGSIGSSNFSFKKYKNYLIYDSLGSGLSVVANHLPTLLISLLLGKGVGGSYFMAYRVLLLPVAVISVSISQFISSKFTTWKENSVYERNLNQMLNFLSFLVFIPSFLLISILPDIFTIILGASWRLAGEIASLCILWVGLKFIFESFILSFILSDNQKFGLYFQVFLIVGRFSSIYLGYYFDYSHLQIIKIFCIFSFFSYLIGIYLIVLVQNLNSQFLFKSLILGLLVYGLVYTSNIVNHDLLYFYIVLIFSLWTIGLVKKFNQIRIILHEN